MNHSTRNQNFGYALGALLSIAGGCSEEAAPESGGSYADDNPGNMQGMMNTAGSLGTDTKSITTGAGPDGTGGGDGGGGGGNVCEGVTEVKEGACKDAAEGVYAIRVAIDVWWGSPEPAIGDPIPLVDPGRGEIVLTLIGEIDEVCSDGSGGQGLIRACGTEVPAFVSDVSCDAYQTIFPDSMWDQWETMPTFTTSGMTTGFNPGDILTLQAATGLLGAELMDDEGEWPAATFDAFTGGPLYTCPSGQGEQCFPDHDADGKPGVTVVLRDDEAEHATINPCTGGDGSFKYRGSPTTLLAVTAGGGAGGGERATELQLGMRVNVGGAGEISADCASGTGAGDSRFVNTRAVSCLLRGEAMAGTAPTKPCTPGDIAFVDGQLPKFRTLAAGELPPENVKYPTSQGGGSLAEGAVSQGARSSVVRLGAVTTQGAFGGYNCAAARGASFPAP